MLKWLEWVPAVAASAFAMTERPSFFVDDTDVPALREVLWRIARVGYSETAVRERLGLQDVADLQWRGLPMYREERLVERDPLALAIELFLLQGTLPVDELDRLLPASDRHVLIRSGLLAVDQTGRGRARASLFPVGDRLIFSDHAWPELPHPGHIPVPRDQVMWVGLDSRHLARSTVRRPVRAALDLCTGSGIHALLAAAHSQQVLAIDINPRAACCTRFNARALGAANIAVVVGDLFEPMRGQRFDLITANPPFVPSPVDALRYRDGGRSGEDILKRIVSGLPHHLAPGGVAHVVTELGERDDEPLVDRVREWLAGASMDIYLLRLGEHTAAKYAIGHAKGDSYEEFLASVQAWANNLRAQGFQRVASALISFQWSDPVCGPPWERSEESPPPQRAAGAEIEAVFLAERMTRQPDLRQILMRGWLRRAGPVALLDARVLGSELRAKTKATLLGQALTIEHRLEPIEREVLNRLDGRTAMPELLRVSRDLDAGEEGVLEAVRLLLGRRLVRIDFA